MNFPTVTWLLSGTTGHRCRLRRQLAVVRCHCGSRSGLGVFARFLSIPFNGSAVTILNGGPDLGLPKAEFSLGEYWDAHYQRKHWFGRKAYWQKRWDRRAPPREWREPLSARKRAIGHYRQ
jgi:hypothetical protein